ncbi:MAG TPA: hypothetical protein VIK80_11040 [Flavihumibacter sp.]|jgi:hypothetical protein
MIKAIRNHRDLLDEKQRLKSLLAVQKNQLHADWLAIEEELEPATKIFKTVGMFTSTKSDNPLMKMGLDFGIDTLLRKTLFRKAGLLAKLGLPILVRNFTANLIDKKEGNGFWENIKAMLKSKNGKATPSATDPSHVS